MEFGGGKIVANGNTLSPAETADTPTATIKGGKQGRLYTLVATDPDAPDPANPTRGEWLHWLVTNIPGGGSASQGAEVVSYMGPAPPVGTHRYIFLLYQQPFQEPLQADDPSGGDAGKRSSFKVKHWAKEHGLGDPVAVTWFNSHK